jgi:non-ribosomal peptide synthetase component E (peptide arylation enzyme)
MIVAGEEKRQKYRAQGWWGDHTLADLFFANAAAHPDRLALVDAPNRADFAFGDPQRQSYAQLQNEVERLAATLLAAGIGKDDVIVIQLPNISEFVALYFAAATIGAIVSPVAVQYRSHELSTMFGIVEPKAFICGTHMKGCDHVGVVPMRQRTHSIFQLLRATLLCLPVTALPTQSMPTISSPFAGHREQPVSPKVYRAAIIIGSVLHPALM